ncbi:DUF6798 domain-containing protein [Coleofasciculus sp.]|uniref:DUF6798 domain-containing protein n=1 Tax=Coleofasciculus sp. TaxID=3100458 RepID=UPI0039FA9264
MWQSYSRDADTTILSNDYALILGSITPVTNKMISSHSIQTNPVNQERTHWKQVLVQILVVTAFLSLGFLLDGNMGGGNEVNILPFARQYADPTWIPGDWYLNQPPGYRIPFLALFGSMAAAWGFLATSLIGRLLCYTLMASGLVFLGRKLGLSLPLLLLAVGLFLYVDDHQGIVAREWLVGGVEPKAVAYGLLLFVIGLMLTGHYRLMALLLGLATFFHIFVGGWASLVIGGWLLLRRHHHFRSIRYLGSIVGIYLIASALSIYTVVEHLLTPSPTGAVEPSYVYVFIRTPHHLNPLYWSQQWWIKLAVYLLVLALSVGVLRRKQQSSENAVRMGLAEFTLLTLIPFGLGLAIAPFDDQGKFLQYYPFRLGDVMLPLNTCLLFACALEQSFTGKARRILLFLCIVLLSGACSIQAVQFHQALVALSEFPSEQQGIDSEGKALCNWIRTNTPDDAVIVTPPAELTPFTWLAQRPTVAKFKFIPPTKVGVLDWYERLSDLSGTFNPWPQPGERVTFSKMKQALITGYNSLTTDQAQGVMSKYGADYLVTSSTQPLDLAIAYRNSRYILYAKSSDGE